LNQFVMIWWKLLLAKRSFHKEISWRRITIYCL
jgi:hypothetical protein